MSMNNRFEKVAAIIDELIELAEEFHECGCGTCLTFWATLYFAASGLEAQLNGFLKALEEKHNIEKTLN